MSCVFHLIRQAPKFKEFIHSLKSTISLYLHHVLNHFTKNLIAGTMHDNLVRGNCVGNLLFLPLKVSPLNEQHAEN